jgi:hypothetical protein
VPLIHRVLQHRARTLVALLALVLAALGLAACGSSGGGGGSGGSSADARTLLTQTFTGSHRVDSGKVNAQLNVDIQGGSSGLKGPIKVTLSGPFEKGATGQPPKFDLSVDAGAQSQSFKAGLVSTGDRLFVSIAGTAYEIPSTLLGQLKQSFKSSQSSGPSLSSLGLHPMNWLKDPTVAGTDSVGGVETEHVTSQLDVSALLDDLDGLLAKFGNQIPNTTGTQIPSHIPAKTRAQIEDAVKSASVEVWTGKDDHTLRKLAVALAIEPPSSSNGPKSVNVSLTVEIDDLNAPQTIEAPTTVRPLSELLGQLQGLLGGASGLGGLGGSSSSGAGSSQKVDKYAKCLQDAGGDPAKIQQCASLLTG